MFIDLIDKKIIAFVQGDIPLISRPFLSLAKDLGISEKEIVDRLKNMFKNGIMRRFGATLRHQKAGFPSNAMVVWRVPLEDCDRVGGKIASFRHVSHCYHREGCENFNYNLFSMIHCSSQEELHKVVFRIAESIKVEEYEILYSEEELKKTSMVYF